MDQSAEVITDSIGPNGKGLTTMLVNHYRFIHPEFLRHRLFNFSVASSRAIPYKKQREQVEQDPSMPLQWLKKHTGMQAHEVFMPTINGPGVDEFDAMWLEARDNAMKIADELALKGVSKQITNRLLEPWVNTRCVVTATEWDNFFKLRCPPSMEIDLNFPAEIHIQDLAIKMKNAMLNSTPTQLKEGELHLPFITETDKYVLTGKHSNPNIDPNVTIHRAKADMIKLSAARCARTSYGSNTGKSIDEEMVLADSLIKDSHWSPFEHQGKALYLELSEDLNRAEKQLPNGCEIRLSNVHGRHVRSVWSRNFKGWIQARSLFEN